MEVEDGSDWLHLHEGEVGEKAEEETVMKEEREEVGVAVRNNQEGGQGEGEGVLSSLGFHHDLILKNKI